MANLTITEISKKYNITTDTIRYYERIGLLPNIPRRDRKIVCVRMNYSLI